MFKLRIFSDGASDGGGRWKVEGAGTGRIMQGKKKYRNSESGGSVRFSRATAQ